MALSNTLDHWFERIAQLVMCHSPSGLETEIDRVLLAEFQRLGRECWQDAAGNVIAQIPGLRPGAIAITAHKDEIGMVVKSLGENGRLQVRRLGGSYPWVYGEGVVDILGDRATLSGILSFGSRHVSHESPQKALQDEAPLTWERAWVETGCSLADLTTAGVRPGTRLVIGKHRKAAFRLKDQVASYTLDNKASLAILLDLAEHLQAPALDVYLVASAKEEVGALGALWFTQRQALEALIALEIIPLASEYPVEAGDRPVLLSQDGYGLYDDGLSQEIAQAAEQAGVSLQWAAISGFGSDASIAMKFGHVARAACLGFATENTHGYEIADLRAIAQCSQVLQAYCAAAK